MGFTSGRRSRSTRRRPDREDDDQARSLLSYLPLGRWFGPGVTVAGVLAAVMSVVTGKVDLSVLDQYRGTGDTQVQPIAYPSLDDRPADAIRVATFNIKQFGDNKADDPWLIATLAQIVSRFDIVAIQEVRSLSTGPVDRLVTVLNGVSPDGTSRSYRRIISQPIGRTTQKESYAFVWDDARVRWIADTAYVVQDDQDFLHREPLVASFETRVVAPDRTPFRFTMINMHTDPDEVRGEGESNELNVLADVFQSVRKYEFDTYGEDDYLLVGDLNVDVGGLGRLGQIPGVTSLAGRLKTNLLRTKTYDHILIDSNVTAEFNGRFGVVDFINDLGLTTEQAEKLSDHLPVFAEFSRFEIGMPDRNEAAAIASRPTTAAVR